MRSLSFWTRTPVVVLTAMLCCFLWGSASPAIKIGYRLFGVDGGDLASRILFAGSRFTIAGLLVLLEGSLMERRFLRPKRGNFHCVAVLMLFQTILQYVFFYTGLAHVSGVRGSIINAVGSFFSIFLAAFVFHFERLTGGKIAGCVLGFLGVLLIVTGGKTPGGEAGFTFAGEGCLILAALSSSFAGCFIKRFSAQEDPVALSGWQFFLGGLVMAAAGYLAGGRLHPAGPGALLLLFYMGIISAGAYTLWSILLKYNDVSRVTILWFMNPVFGVLLSALFLGEGGEAFSAITAVSLLLVTAGVVISERRQKNSSRG